MKKIPASEITFTNRFDLDPVGRVFFWKGKVYRAIAKEYENHIKNLFASGLIKKLVEHNLIPETHITRLITNESKLVIEHKKIISETYPYEWSFNMFKDAATTVLKVNEIAREFGYQIKDSHPYNILFDFFEPKFIDLGSFIPLENQSKAWTAYEEFLRAYYYPLKIWSVGFDFLAFRIRHSASVMISHYEYYLFRYPFIAVLPRKAVETTLQYSFIYRRLSAIPNDLFRFADKRLVKIATFLKNNNLLFFQKINFKNLSDKITKLNKKTITQWDGYHESLAGLAKKNRLPKRFARLLVLVRKYKIKSVVDLGGNSGAFSKLLLTKTPVDIAVCVDTDENAINSMYTLNKLENPRLIPVVQNPVSLTTIPTDRLLFERYSYDAVFALALTHHLILTQGYSADLIFNSFKKYTNKYIFIEFMPLGLYYGKHSPTPPPWYTSSWFKAEFLKHFHLLEIEELDTNRVLFIGKIKDEKSS